MALLIRAFQVILGITFLVTFIRFSTTWDLGAGLFAIIVLLLFLLFEMHEKQNDFFEEMDRKKLLKELEEEEKEL